MLYPIFYGFIAPDSASAKPMSAMKAAADLASKLNAQLSVAVGALHLSVRGVLSYGTPEMVVSDENKRSADSAAAARARVIELARGSGLTVHTEILKGDFDLIKRSCASRARLHGMVFAEAGIPGEYLAGALLESLIFESGRPIFIVPNGFHSEPSFDHVLIAWDGSVGATRAVWNSIPLLHRAKTIEIVTVTGEKELNAIPAGDTLAPALAYLGKKITVSALPRGDNTVAGVIRKHASASGAGLIVQGAYGRSRWSELILGGVTREMLDNCPLPMLMSY
jgi:nucleotide-binding universal stress UspA family protein